MKCVRACSLANYRCDRMCFCPHAPCASRLYCNGTIGPVVICYHVVFTLAHRQCPLNTWVILSTNILAILVLQFSWTNSSCLMCTECRIVVSPSECHKLLMFINIGHQRGSVYVLHRLVAMWQLCMYSFDWSTCKCLCSSHANRWATISVHCTVPIHICLSHCIHMDS